MKRLLLVVGAFLAFLGILYRGRGIFWRRLLRLPAPRCRVRIERNVRILMPDGVVLTHDHLFPQSPAPRSLPVLLIRTPYGRNWRAGWFGVLLGVTAQRFAEHGYHVIVQDVRGRFDSGGQFMPGLHEREDGLATLAWLRDQPWFGGKVGMWGSSYLGIVQWVIADAPEIGALMPMITASHLYDVVFPDGVFDLGLLIRWIGILALGEKRRHRSLITGLLMMAEVEWRSRRAFRSIPVLHAADALVKDQGKTAFAAIFREWLSNTDRDGLPWSRLNETVPPGDIHAPVFLVGGWYDFFLRGLLEDYAALRAAGKNPRLTIGAWEHFSQGFLLLRTPRMAFDWFDQHLKGGEAPPHSDDLSVRLYVMGADEWRRYPEYPPRGEKYALFLSGGGYLSTWSGEGSPDQFTYDPARPTPYYGGAQFSPFAGARDNRRLEKRADVITYTSAALDAPIDVIGVPEVDLYVTLSAPGDFFVRLCDVHPDGRSINVCDGFTRVNAVNGADQPCCVHIRLWATAYQFRAGHRLRLTIAGGAHPHWSRHTGGANPLQDTDLRPVVHSVYHDRDCPSALTLPVVHD